MRKYEMSEYGKFRIPTVQAGRRDCPLNSMSVSYNRTPRDETCV